ncbi:MAG: glutamate 5-kinase [Candidatus Omnitrophica bacterium]|nr:glutamate 5-kinase [Candidatus Omnitrophota bacterium]
MKQLPKVYKRIVIKIGSSLFYSDKNKLDCSLLSSIAEQISELVNNGREIVIVSSGAIALGMSVLHLDSRPKDLSILQAAAAIGQHELMDIYRRFLKENNLNCAQILLTWDDFDDRLRYLNAKNTILSLLKFKAIPVINENDTVSTDEIKFGDNDRLSAMVAALVGADLLIILSDVDGLLDKDRKSVISLVEKITPQIKSLASPTQRKTSVGGMIAKIDACRIGVDSGIPCVIANGRENNIISLSVNNPGACGTLFLPKKDYLAQRLRWIAFSAKPKGRIIVDDGAKNALLNKKSLLSVGVVSLLGDFETGDIVSLVDKQNLEFARGQSRISSIELERVKGSRFDKEIVHRDNIVIL